MPQSSKYPLVTPEDNRGNHYAPPAADLLPEEALPYREKVDWWGTAWSGAYWQVSPTGRLAHASNDREKTREKARRKNEHRWEANRHEILHAKRFNE